MVRADGVHDPGSAPHRLSFLMDRIDKDEFSFLVTATDTVDDERPLSVKCDPHYIFGMDLGGKASRHVERSFRSCRRCAWSDQECREKGEFHCRPATSASTIVGSASVEMSPKPPVVPSAIFLKIRRMILPERVLGSAGVKWIFSGTARAPMSFRTSWLSSFRSSSVPSSPATRVT